MNNNKIRFLAVLAVLVMAFAAVAVVSVSENSYATIEVHNEAELAEAVALGSEDTIVLAADINLTNRIDISDGQVVTIDMNGHSISKDSLPFFISHGTLNLIGTGTVYETEDNGYGTVYINGSQSNDADYSVLNVGSDVTLKGWSGVFIGSKSYGIKVDIRGHIVSPGQESHPTAGHGIYVHGNAVYTEGNVPIISIHDGATITSKGEGLYLAGFADVTIGDQPEGVAPVISGVDSALEIRSGILTINKGTFTASNNDYTVNPNGDGPTTTGAAIAVAQHTTVKPITITIVDGTFTGVKSLSIANPQENPDVAEQVSVSVSGGTFGQIINSNGGTLSITGGTFESDPSDYVANGYFVNPDAAGTYTVYNNNKAVAQIGEQMFASLNDAVAAVQNEQTIVTLCNIAQDSTVLVNRDVSFTIQLDHDITFADAVSSGHNIKGIRVQSGTVTLTGTGTVTGGSYDAPDYEQLPVYSMGGTINIYGGNYVSTSCAEVIFVNATGQVNISGGTFSSTDPTDTAKGYMLNVSNGGSVSKMRVTGGTFNGYNPATGDDALHGTFVADGYVSKEVSDGVYQVVQGYTVTFRNYDSTELQSGVVAEGVIPVYEGETPTKPASAQYEYAFIGWNPEIVPVAGNATYTAVFSETPRAYMVTFKNYDGTILQQQEFTYGTMPAYSGEAVPMKPSTAADSYNFSGWGEIVAVTAEAAYTAQFTPVANQVDYYPTLVAAIKAVQSGATITLRQDITLDGMVVLNKSVTINLNGYVLQRADNTASVFQVYRFSTADTIPVLTIDGTTPNSKIIGRLNVGANAGQDGSLVLNGGVYSVGSGQTCLHVMGNCSECSVSIYGASLTTPDDNAIQFNGGGKFYIKDSVISGGTAIYMKAGALTIAGDNDITATKTKTEPVPNGNGSNPTGDAIVMDAHSSYKGQMRLSISDKTTISSTYGYAILETVTAGTSTATLSMSINGTLSGKLGVLNISEALEQAIADKTAKVEVVGGSFNDVAIAKYAKAGSTIQLVSDLVQAGNPETVIAEGATLQINSGFTWTVDGTLTIMEGAKLVVKGTVMPADADAKIINKGEINVADSGLIVKNNTTDFSVDSVIGMITGDIGGITAQIGPAAITTEVPTGDVNIDNMILNLEGGDHQDVPQQTINDTQSFTIINGSYEGDINLSSTTEGAATGQFNIGGATYEGTLTGKNGSYATLTGVTGNLTFQAGSIKTSGTVTEGSVEFTSGSFELTGDMTFCTGTTLTIEAGVTLTLGDYNLTIQPGVTFNLAAGAEVDQTGAGKILYGLVADGSNFHFEDSTEATITYAAAGTTVYIVGAAGYGFDSDPTLSPAAVDLVKDNFHKYHFTLLAATTVAATPTQGWEVTLAPEMEGMAYKYSIDGASPVDYEGTFVIAPSKSLSVTVTLSGDFATGYSVKWDNNLVNTTRAVAADPGITGDVTWTAAPFKPTITFDGKGATSGVMSVQKIAYNTATAINSNAFAKTDYGFAGWDTDPAGATVVYANNADITLTDNVTLYAVWKQVTITFNGKGATSGGPETQTIPYGIATALTASTLVKAGSAFAGWDTAEAGTSVVKADGASVTLTADTTYYAVWKGEVTVTFDANLGSGTMPAQVIPVSAATKLNANAFTAPATKAFLKWNTQADGLGADYLNEQEVTLAADVTLYAIWSDSVTVTFDGKDATSGTMSDQVIPQSSATALSANLFVKTGYTFMGWDTASAGTTIVYTDEQAVSLAANTTLYAVWYVTVNVTPTHSSIDYGAAVPVDGFAYTTSPSVSPSGALTYATTYTQGSDAGNYTISITGGALTLAGHYFVYGEGTLTVEPLTITVKPMATSKIYGEDDPVIGFTATGALSGEVAAFSGALTYTGTNVGSYAIAKGTLALANGTAPNTFKASNYTLIYDDDGKKFTITAKTLYINGVFAADKVYDGTTAGVITGTPELVGVIAGDEEDVTIGGTHVATFSQSNVGDDLVVEFSGFTITGTKATNYELAGQPANDTANITKREVVIAWSEFTPEQLVYSGTAKTMTATISNYGTGDSADYVKLNVAVTTTEGYTDNVNVTANGFKYKVTGLAAGTEGDRTGNYKLPAIVESDAQIITAFELTVSVVADSLDRAYDATTDCVALVEGTHYTIDKFGTENVHIAYTGAVYSSKDVGDRTVNVTGISLTGDDKDNYTVGASAELAATISKAALTITADDKEVTYGDAAPALTANNGVGWVNDETYATYSKTADNVAAKLTTAYTTESPAGTVPITWMDGSEAILEGWFTNYDVTLVAGEITVNKQVVAWPAIDTKVYNGSVQTATVPESARYTVTANVGGTDVGTYPVTLTLTDADNYKWSDVDTADKTVADAFGITKAMTNPCTAAVVKIGLLGDGTTPLELLETLPVATFGTVLYSVDGGDYTAEVPKASAIGFHTVNYMVEETPNYVGVDPLETPLNVKISKEPEPVPVVHVTKVTLDKSTHSMYITDLFKLTATVSPDNATDKGIIWTSSNEDVAIVSEDGVITPVAEGKATITATSHDNAEIFATCELTVTPASLPVFTVTFDAKNATEPVDKEVVKDKQVPRPEDPVKAGNRFTGWYTADPAEVVGAVKWVFTDPVTEDMTLYAGWTDTVKVALPADTDMFDVTGDADTNVGAEYVFQVVAEDGFGVEVFANGVQLVPGIGGMFTVNPVPACNLSITIIATDLDTLEETTVTQSLTENDDGSETAIKTVTTEGEGGITVINETATTTKAGQAPRVTEAGATVAGDIATIVIDPMAADAFVTDAMAQAVIDAAEDGVDVMLVTNKQGISIPVALFDDAKVGSVSVIVNDGQPNMAMVSIPEGAIIAGTEPIAVSLTGSNKVVDPAAAGVTEATQAFEISVRNAASGTSFSGTVTVSKKVAIPSNATDVMFYCPETGDMVFADFEDGYATGQFSHFSLWAVVYNLSHKEIPVDDEPQEEQNVPAEDVTPTTDSSDEGPKTIVVAVAAIAALCVAMVALMVVRRN